MVIVSKKSWNFQDRDFFVKTKDQDLFSQDLDFFQDQDYFFALEAPWDQEHGLEDYVSGLSASANVLPYTFNLSSVARYKCLS